MQFYHPLSQEGTRRRRNDGHAIAEFVPALTILAFLVFIPLLDLTIVPIRWMLAQQLVEQYVRKLALCESFSEARATMVAEPSLHRRIERLGGVTVDSLDLHLRIANASESVVVDSPSKIDAAWLPDGSKGPCTYTLQVDAHSLLSPAILFPIAGPKVPGLNAPIPLVVSASHAWGNLGRNPISRKFFLNE